MDILTIEQQKNFTKYYNNHMKWLNLNTFYDKAEFSDKSVKLTNIFTKKSDEITVSNVVRIIAACRTFSREHVIDHAKKFLLDFRISDVTIGMESINLFIDRAENVKSLYKIFDIDFFENQILSSKVGNGSDVLGKCRELLRRDVLEIEIHPDFVRADSHMLRGQLANYIKSAEIDKQSTRRNGFIYRLICEDNNISAVINHSGIQYVYDDNLSLMKITAEKCVVPAGSVIDSEGGHRLTEICRELLNSMNITVSLFNGKLFILHAGRIYVIISGKIPRVVSKMLNDSDLMDKYVSNYENPGGIANISEEISDKILYLDDSSGQIRRIFPAEFLEKVYY